MKHKSSSCTNEVLLSPNFRRRGGGFAKLNMLKKSSFPDEQYRFLWASCL